jgi:hypothetical protein
VVRRGYKFFSGKTEGNRPVGRLDVNERIILKWNLEWNMKVLTEFI